MTGSATKRTKLVLATRNKGKIAEIEGLLSELPIDLVGLDSFADVAEVPETGSTFDENARLKATGYALQTGSFALADDSGLEVAALDGRPGVHSARYGGEGAGFTEKIAMLLDEVERTGGQDRRARFVCSLAIADAMGNVVFTANGICDGRLAINARGTGGFGYDPVFVPDGFDGTFGELSSDIKQEISHRARAFRQIIPFLRHFSSISA